MPKIHEKSRFALTNFVKFILLIFGSLVLFFSIKQELRSLNNLKLEWQNHETSLLIIISIILIFSSLNWLGEAKKWQYIVSTISLKEAAKQTIISHSLALLTPNKWGEYPAKCLFYSKNKATKIIAFTTLSHSTQLVATLVFGFIGIILVFDKLIKIPFKLSNGLWYMLLSILIICGMFCLPFIKKHVIKVFVHLKDLQAFKIQTALACSFFRYLVFSHQFFILLLCFGIKISYGEGMALIFVIYFLSSIIPVFSLTDIIVKGGIAVSIFSFLGYSASMVLTTTFVMWLSNVILPAGIGYISLWFWNPKFSTAKT